MTRDDWIEVTGAALLALTILILTLVTVLG